MLSEIVGWSVIAVAFAWTIVYKGPTIMERLRGSEEEPAELIPPHYHRHLSIHASDMDGPVAPGTRVVFPNGHYIIGRPAHIKTNGYGRMLNKPHHRIPGYEYTI